MSRHQNISYIKSLVRIAGYAFLIPSIGIGVFLLIVSEAIGVIEEIGE